MLTATIDIPFTMEVRKGQWRNRLVTILRFQADTHPATLKRIAHEISDNMPGYASLKRLTVVEHNHTIAYITDDNNF